MQIHANRVLDAGVGNAARGDEAVARAFALLYHRHGCQPELRDQRGTCAHAALVYRAHCQRCGQSYDCQ